MSSIPPPGSDYGYYGGSLRRNESNGVGFTDTSSGAGNIDPQERAQYCQQLQNAYNNYIALKNGGMSSPELDQHIQLCQQYAQEVGYELQGGSNQWDPNAGTGMNSGAPTFPISWQDANHIVSEEGAQTHVVINHNDSDKRAVDFYQKHNAVQVPSAGASVSVVASVEGTDHKLEVTITYSDGTTRRLTYHNTQREGFNLDIQVPDVSQVTKDPAITNCNVSELGSSSQTQQAGDAPTRMDGDKRVYDGQSFNISPVASGTNKESTVLASGDVTLTPNSNEEFYVIDYQATPAPAKYIVKVYANEADKAATPPKVKETITIDATLVDHVNFAGDASRLTYGSSLAVAAHPEQLDTNKPGAGKIGTGSVGGITDPLDPNHLTDTAPDSKDEATHTAYYNNPDNVGQGVDLHAYYDDAYTTHNVTTPGPVTIRTTSYSDTVKVTKNADGTYTIDVYKNGIESGANMKKETFIVSGPPSKINIDALPAKIRYGVDDGDPSTSTAYVLISEAASDPLISVAGVSGTDTTATLSINDLPPAIKSLKEMCPAINMEQFLSKLKAKFPNIDANNDGKISKEELQAAVTNKIFPPFRPTKELVEFLVDIDPELKAYVDIFNNNRGMQDPAYSTNMGNITNRLIGLLKVLYPGVSITAFNSSTGGVGTTWQYKNNISFDGHVFEAFSEVDGHRGELNFLFYS